jgi:polyferredoxin
VRVLRPRIVLYGLVLLGLLASLLVAIGMRTPLGLDVIRDRNTLFRETGTGQLENVYVLKLLNMDTLPHEYRLEVSGAPSLNLEMDSKVLKVESGGVLEVPARLQIEPVDMHSRSLEVEFQLTAIDDPHLSVVEKARFVGPLPPR